MTWVVTCGCGATAPPSQISQKGAAIRARHACWEQVGRERWRCPACQQVERERRREAYREESA